MLANDVMEFEDKGAGLFGCVVIHSLFDGQASGGLRIDPKVNRSQLAALAMGMTAKYGYYGLPKGGAKAGIRFDPEGDPAHVRELLLAFGEKIADLVRARRYFPGPDMGTDDARIRVVLEGAGVAPDDASLWDTTDTGLFTAAGVVASLRVALARSGKELGGARVQIEGIGAVGGSAWRILHEQGACVAGVSNRYGAIVNEDGIEPAPLFAWLAERGGAAIQKYPGARAVEPRAFCGLSTDAFLPCGASFTLTETEAAALASPLIVAGANAPVYGPAWETLKSRGQSILALPDFVTNGGGVVGGALHYAGLSKDETVQAVESIVGSAVAGLLEEGAKIGALDEGGRALVVFAEDIAHSRFKAMEAKPRSQLLLLGMRAKRLGLLPDFMSHAGAAHYAATLRDWVGRIER